VERNKGGECEMNKLFAALKRAPKRSASILMIAAAIIVPAALFAWGPARTTYTIEQPADHVVFNSITNNPAYGDERQFVQIKDASAPNSTYSTSASLVAGKTYEMYVYYHNNAASNLNDAAHNYRGVANGAYMRSALPATVAGATKATAYVGAANASPSEVYADVTMTSANGSPVALRYVANSAHIYNGGASNGSALSDNIITTGVPLGYDKLDGVVPGCNNYAGYVTFKFVATQPNFTVTKQVREQGTADWKKSIDVQPGKTVEYKIAYTNTGTTTQNNVVLNDTLPTGLTYVAGSTILVNPANPNGKVISDNVTKGGVNIGSYNPGSNAYIRFSATVPAESALTCNQTSKFTNKVTAETDNGNKQDTADVSTSRTCTTPTPVYTCDALAVHKISDTEYKFDGLATAKDGATIVNYTFDFGDSTTQTVTNPTDVAHTYTKSGNYNVSMSVTFNVNGVQKTVTSNSCKATVCVTIPVVPVYTCDSLTVTKIDRTHFSFATKYTVTGATFKSVTYVVTDASNKEVSRSASANYTQTTPGTYAVQAIVTVTVNGVDKTVTSENCKKSLEVTPPPVVTITVCDLTTKKIVTINENDFDSSKYSKDLNDCKPPVMISVCDLTTKKIVTIDEKNFDSAKYSKNLEDCAVPNKIQVCELATKKVISIDEKDFDSAKYSKNLDDCKAPVMISVCELDTKKIISIDEKNFDASKYSKDLNDCKETPPVAMCTVPGKENLPADSADCAVTPTELPHTGASDNILTLVGAGSLIAAFGYYVASRKALGQ
jgi:uncharacterized repeat protein (TIGR01451 family)/LPXTG-motif cell wall-anchored protein